MGRISDFFKENKRNFIVALFFAFIFSIDYVIGEIVYRDNQIFALYTPIGNLTKAILKIAGFTIIFGVVFSLAIVLVEKLSMVGAGERRYAGFAAKRKTWYGKAGAWILAFLITFAAVFASFYLAFLVYYPGMNRYDFSEQARQAIAGVSEYTKHHPPLHTYLISRAINYGNAHESLAITRYAKVQMPVMAAIFSLALVYLIYKRVRTFAVVFAYIFVIFNPVIAIFSLIPVKDTCFGAGFLVLFILLFELCSNTKKCLSSIWFWVEYSLVALICCLFRNNAKYALILCVPFTCLCLRSEWKRVLALLLIPFLLLTVVDKGIYSGILGIEDGSNAEKLCVPMQQMANVVIVNGKDIPSEYLEIIDTYIPVDEIANVFSPRDADPLKVTFKTDNYDGDKALFWKNWLKLGLKYPGCYVGEFLALNIPYWYVKAETIDPYSNRQYIEVTGEYEDRSLTTRCLKLLDQYEKIASFEAMDGLFVVETIFAISTPIWVLMFVLMIMLAKHQNRLIPVILPAMFLWLTHIAGPLSNFRYMFPIFILYPGLFALAFAREDVTGGHM